MTFAMHLVVQEPGDVRRREHGGEGGGGGMNKDEREREQNNPGAANRRCPLVLASSFAQGPAQKKETDTHATT